jgi:hypothetical protein
MYYHQLQVRYAFQIARHFSTLVSNEQLSFDIKKCHSFTKYLYYGGIHIPKIQTDPALANQSDRQEKLILWIQN